jgi:hypothetical protein
MYALKDESQVKAIKKVFKNQECIKAVPMDIKRLV